MPVKRAKMLIPLTEFAPELESHQSSMNELENLIIKIEEGYQEEIAKIQSNFTISDDKFFSVFKQYENDYLAAISYIEDEYELLFSALKTDFLDNNQKQMMSLQMEDDSYNQIITTFKSLQEQAHKKYIELCKASEYYIDRETSIHHQFVEEEDQRFEEIRKNYSGINNRQYDTLLWSMEKSKNALGDLSKKLNEQAFNDTKFLTASVIKTIENLRETKNNITVIFKGTTQSFVQKKRIIDDLSLVRQKPHSVLNQRLINQFVEQIHNVNDSRSTFEKLVNNDLSKSMKVIGEKLIAADLSKDDKLTKKYVLQYQIVQSKAKFLLKRNNEMSDLLISKYQNEIKKIKIDSFRRVEEIKLAYYMPSEFFQNSINLYSNFAFYINESMDEIDNLLSDFIRFNQNITQTTADYIHSSSKVFEDYKINLLVTVNDATNKITELISNVDHISKEIIELESKNRIEIAEIRKSMENADITGDYQKYLKSLDFDRFFADYQHEINSLKIKASAKKTESLLSIQSEITQSNKERQLDEDTEKQTRLLFELEKQIHESLLDKEFMLAEAKHQKILAMIEAERKMQYADVLLSSKRTAYLYGTAIASEQKSFEQTQFEGNAYVVDYVHETQKLIDLHRLQTQAAKDYIRKNTDKFRYARVLENERLNLTKALYSKFSSESEPYQNAIDFYSHLLCITHKHLQKRINKYDLIFKHLLIHLRKETTQIQAKALESASAYKTDLVYAFDNAKETLVNICLTCNLNDMTSSISNYMEETIYKITRITQPVEKAINHQRKSLDVQQLLKSYYIQMILTIKNYKKHIKTFFETALTRSIENDFLIIMKLRNALAKEKQIVDNEYEMRIFEAARKKHSNTKLAENLETEYAQFELLMKERVFQLNKTFLEVLSNENDKLKYLKEELLRAINQAEIDYYAATEKIDNSIAEKIQKAQKDFLNFENNYISMKSKLLVQTEKETLTIKNELIARENNRKQQLTILNQSIASLPGDESSVIAKLENDKLALMSEKKVQLNKEFAEIEELKLLSTPIYLEKIKTVNDRLPNDYMHLYKEIADAEMALIKEHRDIEMIYQQNFGRFINNQMEYNSILFNDSIVLYPYDKNLATTKAIVKKSNELFKDTVDKSSMAQDLINKKTIESNEKQKRVLNV